MRFRRCLRYSDLPKPFYPKSDKERDVLVKEFDEVFEKLAADLGKIYLVDDKGGLGPENAAISMCQYISVGWHHTIVTRSRHTLTKFGFPDNLSLWWRFQLIIMDACSTLKYRWKWGHIRKAMLPKIR